MNGRMEFDQLNAVADHGDLSDYYSYDELENDNKLGDQEEDHQELLTSIFQRKCFHKQYQLNKTVVFHFEIKP